MQFSVEAHGTTLSKRFESSSSNLSEMRDRSELSHKYRGRGAERSFGGDGAIGRDLEQQPVVRRTLAESNAFYPEAGASYMGHQRRQQHMTQRNAKGVTMPALEWRKRHQRRVRRSPLGRAARLHEAESASKDLGATFVEGHAEGQGSRWPASTR